VKKWLWIIGGMIAVAVVVGFIFRDLLFFMAFRASVKPATAFTDTVAPPAPDYSKSEHWAALPDREDAADFTLEGVIDGQENTWSNMYSKKFYEVQKYITGTDHGYLGYMVVTNAQFWNYLPKDVRMELEAILAEVTAWIRVNALKINMAQKAKIVAAGTTKVTELTEAEKDAFRTAFKPVHNEFREVIGGDLIDAVYELNKKN